MSDETEALRLEVLALTAKVEALSAFLQARALAVPIIGTERDAADLHFAGGRAWDQAAMIFAAGALMNTTADPGADESFLHAYRELGLTIQGALEHYY